MNKQERGALFRQSIGEADIDWLFCIELNACEVFQHWIASHLFPALTDFQSIRAWRSVSHMTGEPNLLWLVKTPNEGQMLALIENKLHAVAQPAPYLRYVQRGEGYVAEGICQRFVVALLAPQQYHAADAQAYPVRISYEAVSAWFAARLNRRSLYLASLYRDAINAFRSNASTLIATDATDHL